MPIEPVIVPAALIVSLLSVPSPGLNRECNDDFTICPKQGVQFASPISGMLAFAADYTAKPAAVERVNPSFFFSSLKG